MMFSGALIDVANVCFDGQLPPTGRRQSPSWERVTTLTSAWERAHPGVPVTYIADLSLKHLLRIRGREWARMRDDLGVVEARVADEAILARAALDSGLAILSRDKFIDHRRTHPWIEQQPERFLAWSMSGPNVTFVGNDIVAVDSRLVSREFEAKDLKAHGLDAKKHRQLLTTRWRCTAPTCVYARLWADQLLVWPTVNELGEATCPGCREPLVALDRSVVRQVVIEAPSGAPGGLPDGSAILGRIPLRVGVPVTLGRGSVPSGVDLRTVIRGHEALLSTVSRQHLFVRPGEHGITVTDLHSTNGTRIALFSEGQHQPPKRLEPDVETALGARDWLSLGHRLWLRLSGTRFAPPDGPNSAGASEPSGTVRLSPLD